MMWKTRALIFNDKRLIYLSFFVCILILLTINSCFSIVLVIEGTNENETTLCKFVKNGELYSLKDLKYNEYYDVFCLIESENEITVIYKKIQASPVIKISLSNFSFTCDELDFDLDFLIVQPSVNSKIGFIEKIGSLNEVCYSNSIYRIYGVALKRNVIRIVDLVNRDLPIKIAKISVLNPQVCYELKDSFNNKYSKEYIIPEKEIKLIYNKIPEGFIYLDLGNGIDLPLYMFKDAKKLNVIKIISDKPLTISINGQEIYVPPNSVLYLPDNIKKIRLGNYTIPTIKNECVIYINNSTLLHNCALEQSLVLFVKPLLVNNYTAVNVKVFSNSLIENLKIIYYVDNKKVQEYTKSYINKFEQNFFLPFTKVGNHTVCIKVIADDIEKQKCVNVVVPAFYPSVYSYIIIFKSPFDNILFIWVIVTIIILIILGRTKYVFKF